MKCVKEYFGHFTDGPNITFLPDTLENILKEKNIEPELIVQIMATINNQAYTSFNEGYKEAKDRINERFHLTRKIHYED